MTCDLVEYLILRVFSIKVRVRIGVRIKFSA